MNRNIAHQIIDDIYDYWEKIDQYPVKSQMKPGDIYRQFPENFPQEGDSYETILSDLKEKILTGMTHWQNPMFFAYFPANASEASFFAEMWTSAIAAQCMSWVTSPAATELEELMTNWLRDMMGLPKSYCGVIQDTASTSTLVALLSARERFSNYQTNLQGIHSYKFTVYFSEECHSSIEKAIKIAGIGSENARKIPVLSDMSMNCDELDRKIKEDLDHGYIPLMIVAAVGSTGTLAFDRVDRIYSIAKHHNIWLHIDAAYAGTALLLPEFRWILYQCNDFDSFVFNPHKWMFTHFDCSVYFVKNKENLIRTFEILPEYLKSKEANPVHNYRDWGIQLGRRFRALKLMFVIRHYGAAGLQEKLRHHIYLTRIMCERLTDDSRFEIMTETKMNVIIFRLKPQNLSKEQCNELNEMFLESINQSGKAFFSHSKIRGHFIIRMVIAQSNVEKKHIDNAWQLLSQHADIVWDKFR